MAANSFAAYASQYLTRQQQPPEPGPGKGGRGGSSTVMSGSTSQPMFFSFTTDNDDGSRHGGAHDSDLDDFDDPHLGLSMGEGSASAPRIQEQDDEDPYLRLDEEEDLQHPAAGSSSRHTGFKLHQQHQQSIPLIARSPSPSSPPGWLAHLAQSPPRRPSPSNNSESDSSPPPDLFVAASPRGPSSTAHAPISGIPPPPPTFTEPHSLSLTDSLLPRDGLTRPLDVFSLPDPRHTPRKRRKHHDAPYISAFLALLSLCIFFCLLLLILTDRPKGVPAVILPYAIMLRTVPILVILTFVSAAVAYGHVYLLRLFVGPVMAATEVFVPATLFVCAIWAFVGSFMWDGDTVPTWGETVGLRLFSIIPLVLSILTARRLLYLPKRIHTTSSTLTLATHILMSNPFILALSPALLIGMLILSIPFITLVFRLLLIGYTTSASAGGLEWHVKAWANWAIALTLGVWFWSWAVARGVLRTTCASVVGAWYFADPALPPPPPTSTHTIHAALTRSTGPSLGSIILASLILTLLRILTMLIFFLQRLPPLLLRIPWVPLAVPVAMYVVPGVRVLVSWLELKTERVSGYALVYVGLTGVGFWDAASRGLVLVGSGKARDVDGQAQARSQGQGRGRGGGGGREAAGREVPVVKKRFSAEPPLALLTISPLTLTFPFALLTYLFVAHTLGAPNEALGAALLAGGMTAIVGLFCVGVVRDTADTLYMCYCIDKAEGERRREEVFVAFEYGSEDTRGRNGMNSAAGTLLPLHNDQRRSGAGGKQTQMPHHRQPETIIPRSPLSRRDDGVLFDVAGGEGEEDTDSGEHQPSPKKAIKTKMKKQKKRSAPISPYEVGSDSEDGDHDDERTPTVAKVLTQTHIPTQTPSNLRILPRQAPRHGEDEEEEDLDPFQTSTTHVDEEALLEGLGSPRGGAGVGGYTSTSPGSGRGVRVHGLGLAQGSNGHQRSTSGMGVVGMGMGVGVAGVGANVGGKERMMTSTQELNMKSQFLMNMHGFGADSGVSASGSQASASASGVVGEIAGEDGSEGEESQLGPGSDFFK